MVRVLMVAGFLAMALPLAARAQDLNTGDLIRAEQAAPVTRFVASATRSAAPQSFDILLATSDRMVNRLVAIGMKKQKPSTTGKKLTALALSFRERGLLTATGTYEMVAKPGENKAGRFQFTVSAALDVQAKHDVVFNVVEASIKLNGDEIFKTTRDNPRPLGTMLDFLSPRIEATAAEQLNEVSTDLATKLGQANVKPLKVSDVITINRNQITLKILPHMLSPLFPKVAIEHVGVDQGTLQIYVSFPEAQ